MKGKLGLVSMWPFLPPLFCSGITHLVMVRFAFSIFGGMNGLLTFRQLQEMLNLKEGTLLEGTVKKIFSYGAQVRIGETNRR